MRYAIIENGICANVIIADAVFAAQIGAVELPEGFGIGDSYNGAEWISNKIIPVDDSAKKNTDGGA